MNFYKLILQVDLNIKEFKYGFFLVEKNQEKVIVGEDESLFEYAHSASRS